MADERRNFGEVALALVACAAVLWAGRALWERPATIESLEAKVRRHPDDAALQEQLGNLLEAAGRHADAVGVYQAALRAEPNRPTAACGLARVLAATGKKLEAQRTLEESLKAHPLDAGVNEGLADLAVASLGELAYPAVQTHYETALRSEPARPGAALALSKIYLTQGRVQDAGRVLVAPLEAHDRHAAMHLQMANILALLGRYPQAAVYYNRATALDPLNAEAKVAWGISLLAMGSVEAAEWQFSEAVRLQPDSALYHMHLGRAKVRLAGGSLREGSEAWNAFATALDKDPKCVAVYLELASYYRSIRSETTAEKWLRQGVKMNPTVEMRAALADFLTNADDPLLRNYGEAAEQYQFCVIETREQDLGLLVKAADACARIDKTERSLELIEKALTWAKVRSVSPDVQEALLARRQRFVLALAPTLVGSAPYDVEGRVVREPGDEPWPEPRQPRVDLLTRWPLMLDRPPGPGSALDPALYISGGKRKGTEGASP